MSYKRLNHTADVRVLISGSTIEELFREGMRVMFKVMDPVFESNVLSQKGHYWTIVVNSADRSALFIDFLNKVLEMSEVNKEVYVDVQFLELTETEVRAKVKGVPVCSCKTDVKGVNYHGSEVKVDDDRLVCEVTFDV
ncbi:archease [Candidatus Dojkabacteria bacterium]|nr:archease [Candidatus Dojkabacteria bacterium]